MLANRCFCMSWCMIVVRLMEGDFTYTHVVISFLKLSNIDITDRVYCLC